MLRRQNLRIAPPVLSFRLAEKKERAAPGVRKKRAPGKTMRSCATPSADWLRLRSRRCPVWRPASQRPHVRAFRYDLHHVGRGNAQLTSQGEGRGGHVARLAEESRGLFPVRLSLASKPVSFHAERNGFCYEQLLACEQVQFFLLRCCFVLALSALSTH